MHFGKRRPSRADHEDQQPSLVGLDLARRLQIVHTLRPRGAHLVFAAYRLNYAKDYAKLLAMCEARARNLEPGGRFVTVNNHPDDPLDNFETGAGLRILDATRGPRSRFYFTPTVGLADSRSSLDRVGSRARRRHR